MRKPAPIKTKLVQDVAAALAAALPGAPKGWQRSGEPKVTEPVLCKGQKPADFSLSVLLAYSIKNPPKRQEYPEEAEIRRLTQEIEALERTPDEVCKRIHEVQERRVRNDARQRPPNAPATGRNTSDCGRRRTRSREKPTRSGPTTSGSVAPQINERKAKIQELRLGILTYTGTKVDVRVTVNARRDLPGPGKGLNRDVLVWGSSKPAPLGTAVCNVFLEIEGWPEYREVILAKIDQARLAALVR